MNLADLWRRITGQHEPPEPIDYRPRLQEIDDALSVGKRELHELAARRRVIELSMGIHDSNGQPY